MTAPSTADHCSWPTWSHAWPDNAIKVRTRSPVSLNEWHHLALTYDGSGKASGVALYLDGRLQEVEVLHDSLTGSIRTERSLLLGRRHAKGMFDGKLDEVRIYDRTLTAKRSGAVGRLPSDPGHPAGTGRGSH